MNMTWLLHNRLVLRTTGVPFDVLDDLRLPDTAAALEALGTVRRALERHREALLREHFPAAVRSLSADDSAARRRLSRQRSAVGRGRPAPAVEEAGQGGLASQLLYWNELLREETAAAERAAARHAAEFTDCRARLHRRAADPAVQEAVQLLSPDFHTALRRYAETPPAFAADGSGGRDARRVELRLATYLQRLAAKNETNGRYGPVDYGRLLPEAAPPLLIRRAAEPGRVTVFSTARLAGAVAMAVRADPRMRRHLRPRRSVTHRFTGDQAVSTVTGRTLSLSGPDARLVALCHGDLTCERLAEKLGEPWARTADRVEALVGRGLLAVAPMFPPDTAYPLAAIAGRLSTLPADDDAVRAWRKSVGRLETLVARSGVSSGEPDARARSELAARYEELSGQSARRGAGRAYADRALVFEEARGRLDRFELGAAPTRALGDGLLPVLDLWRTAALLRRCDHQRRCGQLLESLGTDRLPLLAYLRAAAGRRELPADEPPPTALLDDRLRGLLAGREDDRQVELGAADVAAIAADAREAAARSDRRGAALPSFTSVDVLLAASDEASMARGAHTLVVGEGHAPPLLSVFPTDHFRREREGGEDPIAALLRTTWSDAGVRVGQVVIARDTKIFAYRLADVLVELRPHLERADLAVPAAHLEVRRTSEGCLLHDSDGVLLLHPQLRRGPGFDPLSPLTLPAVEDHPLVLGGHTPRLTIGGVVYQRERWQTAGLPWDASLSGFGLLRAAHEWRGRNRMPEYVYYRVPEEPKPLLLDFTSRHLVEVFHRHAARTAGPVTLTEMLPGPSDLWLRSPAGRHTFELRVFAVHGGGSDAAAGGWGIHRTPGG
ncbi:lantibiotic dehydratase family protein [Streptomyces huiliensis]|uniref:lantibiotic dehydratase family protein n=1 Tax=Streptomyces huiliensis TaxID=2876027 RepID=UPI001CBFA86C|nr:lantibiotic dehydratase family protein [Streptomyces huiliensis]MBZ4319938.1 lantibiotic dehydratase family protein [Streptomyces huiliensis]